MSTWRTLRAHPELWERYFIREKVFAAIRSFFVKKKFHEVETPLLAGNPAAESYLDVFQTTLLDRHRNPTRAYLSTSPEISLKKLMVAGLGNCFSLTKAFRNMETQGKLHNPEFTILEWYRVNADYTDIMRDCENLFLSLVSKKTLVYQGKRIDISSAWERLTVSDAFKKYADVAFEDFFHDAPQIAKNKGYAIEKNTTWEQLYNQIFLNEVEPHLGFGKPTILYDFPAAMGALAKKKADDPRFVERFEFYIAGLELGDCYSELTDAKEQEERFESEMKEIQRLGKTIYEYDHDFIDALKIGLPRSSGIAVGIDRLIMLLADVTDIADVLFFPAKDMFRMEMI